MFKFSGSASIILILTSYHIPSTEASVLPFDKVDLISLEDVITGEYFGREFNGSWVDDKHIQFFSRNGDLVLYNVKLDEKNVVLPGNVIQDNLGYGASKCDFSGDQKYVLISYDLQRVYRHSVFALYSVYERDTGKFYPIHGNLGQGGNRLQLAYWTQNNGIVFVQWNDVWYKKSVNVDAVRLSKDGGQSIFNGIADWVYEEEMFSTASLGNQAVWTNTNSDKLAYVKFNDTLVDNIQFSIYGDPGNPHFQYPIIEHIPYPKSGSSNPIATVHIVDLKTFEEKEVELPHVIPFENYVGRVSWTNAGLLVNYLNRFQNESWIVLCDSLCQVIHSMTESSGWIDVNDIIEDTNTNSFLMLSPVQMSDGKSYKHIVRFNVDSIVEVITRGEFSVDEIKGINKNNEIFFTAPGLKSPSQMHLYMVKSGGEDMKCLTCSNCKYSSVVMSKKMSYFVRTCFGKVPEVRIMGVKKKKEIIYEDNKRLSEKLAKSALPLVKKYEIKIEKNYTLLVKLYVPFDFDETKKYPLIIDTYGGPGRQKNTEMYPIDWGTSLVSSKNIVYGSIDGRGSGRQSVDFMFEVYKRLGTVEVDDQIFGTKWLLDNLEWLDRSRVTIWGWSYGGFVTAMVMGRDKDIFRCGISVAPVTNWAFYDSIYTERYMSLPHDNPDGYNSSDVTNHISNFANKNYFLVHGNADDNVLYQQSMVLSRKLELNNILFREQSYPDENHSLGGVRRHLYHTLEDFLQEKCWS